MIRSMTGFGRGNSEEKGRSLTVEIKSVNHRYLDLNIKMPRSLLSLEDRIRKAIQQEISRGKVDVYITQNACEKENVGANFNTALGDSYYKCLQEIKERYVVRDDISVSLIARFPDVVFVEQSEEDMEEVWHSLQGALQSAIFSLATMREKEGEKLQDDVMARCDTIQSHINAVAARAPFVVKEYKEKLNQRLNEMLKDVKMDENRIAMEIAIFADKVSIEEEIVRLNSHIIQMKDIISLKEPVGRKLDFLIQEMNRETNTIGSKANDLELVNLVLNIKNEIEKIREQVQNIE